ncbi:MAG: FeMo cofactor biosynthesis protein [Methanobrevibacter arboriphilus]|uniref:FeMo cofactor biosynthesis protein n=1 Tax=Methanobrevibacter arboriphilus TaxID=39441 RepID=A0A843AQ46_METAZ|nr:NifB/NifX family molybdenum-iron cluster-binding protein [Methanobrevibacter arboriphilus]MBF4469359.1 FeMo cofactor biosynthesis protein [Methanobrevibacter arboriphilus]MCC7561872.1 FeMo cofactor biosynthesis protein [Methanobrevibacter arboriphilus]
MRIAVASSDGKNVDLHFGKARSICIFDFDEEGNNKKFIEKRSVEFNPGEKHQWMKTLNAIGDCDVVICVQAGFKSKFGIEESGIKLVEDEGPIDEALNRYIDHYKFMKTPI